MYAFTFHRPQTVRQAAGLLAKNADAKLLAGGQTLLPTMKLRLAGPPQIIDMSLIEGLSGIELSGRSLSIGAMTRHNDVNTSPVVQQAIPVLAKLAGMIGDPAVSKLARRGSSNAPVRSSTVLIRSARTTRRARSATTSYGRPLMRPPRRQRPRPSRPPSPRMRAMRLRPPFPVREHACRTRPADSDARCMCPAPRYCRPTAALTAPRSARSTTVACNRKALRRVSPATPRYALTNATTGTC